MKGSWTSTGTELGMWYIVRPKAQLSKWSWTSTETESSMWLVFEIKVLFCAPLGCTHIETVHLGIFLCIPLVYCNENRVGKCAHIGRTRPKNGARPRKCVLRAPCLNTGGILLDQKHTSVRGSWMSMGTELGMWYILVDQKHTSVKGSWTSMGTELGMWFIVKPKSTLQQRGLGHQWGEDHIFSKTTKLVV